MTTYTTIDGATFVANDATDLMEQFRADSFNPGPDLKSYCKATARAAKIQCGERHRSWPPSLLVADLISSGLVSDTPPNITYFPPERRPEVEKPL
jgi:hypothetical protein